MNLYVSQIYIEPGINYPFSHIFQKFISDSLSDSVVESPYFIKKYGENFSLVFNMSAKIHVEEVEIHGPSVYHKGKNVEYTIFVPFEEMTDKRYWDSVELAKPLKHLFSGIILVLEKLEIDPQRVVENFDEWIRRVTSDAAMISSEKWWHSTE
jgi:hypothetical protein